jgi:hypothetical protein
MNAHISFGAMKYLNASIDGNRVPIKKKKIESPRKMLGLKWANRSSTFFGRVLRRREGSRSRILELRLRLETPELVTLFGGRRRQCASHYSFERNWAGPDPSQIGGLDRDPTTSEHAFSRSRSPLLRYTHNWGHLSIKFRLLTARVFVKPVTPCKPNISYIFCSVCSFADI